MCPYHDLSTIQQLSVNLALGNKTIWCDPLSMVYIILFWYDHTNTV